MKAKTRKAAPRGKRLENKEKTRKAILRAALDLFAEKGFYQTTTKAIARKAGIAEGTLFNYFETKEDLALYFFEEELTRVIAWYEGDRRLQRASLAEKLFAIIHRFLDGLEPYEEFIGAVYIRALTPASKLSPLSLQNRDRN
jgi:AcrR family transcriptional regulator